MIDRAHLESVIRAAGALALAHWPGAGHRVRVWDKAPGDPVSEADLAVDSYLREALGGLLPAAGWLSEETADDPVRLAKDLVWVVDPIDGTRDYIRGRSGWAVSVALVRGGKPLLALLHAPARGLDPQGELWRAEAGQGSWCGDRRLRASQRRQLEGARVPADALPHGDGDLVAVARPNSIALRIAMVAAGEADLVATARWGHEWDLAAAALIAREAGACVTDAHGAPLAFNQRDPRAFGVLASAPAIHAAAAARIAARIAAARASP